MFCVFCGIFLCFPILCVYTHVIKELIGFFNYYLFMHNKTAELVYL